MWLFGSWVFPAISAAVWLGMLLALFIDWEALGHPILPSMKDGQTIAYISDTGAFGLKPLFIAGCIVTTVFLDLGFISERWLRHTGRLARNTSYTQKVLSGFAIAFAICGSLGLILLSIFDTYRHSTVHDGCLLLFIGGYIISAIFLCAEYQRLGIHYRNHRILRISFWVKLAFILIEVAMAIIFASTKWSKKRNVSAVFEWLIALIFTGYILSFLLDLLPSVQTSHHVPQGYKDGPRIEKGHEHEFAQNLTKDSAGPADNVSGGYRGTAAQGNGQTNSVTPSEKPVQKKGFGRLHF
jgi:Frag1/DRAM/Sfk1 family